MALRGIPSSDLTSSSSAWCSERRAGCHLVGQRIDLDHPLLDYYIVSGFTDGYLSLFSLISGLPIAGGLNLILRVARGLP
jgi:hypothetical protein